MGGSTSIEAPVKIRRRPFRSMRNTFCVAAALSIGILGLSIAPAGAAAKPLENVSCGASTSSILNLPIWVGQADGFYAKQGLNVQWVLLSASTITTALVSGSVNFATASPTTYMQAIQAADPVVSVAEDALGLPLGFVVSSTFAQAHGITASTPTATAFKDLVGSTGGASAASTLAQGNLALEEFGVEPSQVSIVTLASPAADEAALQKNQINWFVTSEPIPLQMQAEGFGIVIGNPTVVKVWAPKAVGYGQVILATTSIVNANSTLMKKIVRGTEAATAYIGHHEQKVLNVAQANSPGVARTLLLKSYKLLSWPATGAMTTKLMGVTVKFIIVQQSVPAGFHLTEGINWTNRFD